MEQSYDLLSAYGWRRYADKAGISCIESGLAPGRIITQFNRIYMAATYQGVIPVEYLNSGEIKAFSEGQDTAPSPGDWVLIALEEKSGEARLIRRILPRYGVLSRNAAGRETIRQALAVNIDIVFIVTSIDDDFSAARIERFLTVAQEAKAQSIILLNKADAAAPERTARALAEAETSSAGSPVLLISARTGWGMDRVASALSDGMTAVMVGSSGVGKSSVINYLLGEEAQKTNAVREADSKGRHTTVRRELFPLPSGGVVIDSPGIKELQLWASEDSLDAVFTDIEELQGSCKYADCSHLGEPGCAVRAAMEEGKLSEKRFENYAKMKRELQFLDIRKGELAARLQKEKWKKIDKQIKEYYRFKKGRF